MTQAREDTAPDRAGLTAGSSGAVASRRRRRYSVLTSRDKLILALMVGIPLIFDLIFIWGPTIASVVLSFSQWNGVHPLDGSQWVGLGNYEKLWSSYAPFWEGVKHNVLWFLVLMLIATPLGMFKAPILSSSARAASFAKTSEPT